MPTLHDLEQIDYAFVDGHHKEQATFDYFEQIPPFAAEPSVLGFDDISWSDGMRRAWNVISASPRIKIAVDLSKLGICVLSSRIEHKKSFWYVPTLWQTILVRAERLAGVE